MKNLWEVQGWLYDSMFLIKPHAELVRAVARHLDPSALVLDAGCGSGRIGLDTEARVIGLDFSSTMLATASRRESAVVQASLVGAIPFADASFDQAVSINVLYALGDQYEQTLRELYRILKPGGQLFLANPVNDQLAPLLKEHFATASPREIAKTIVNAPRFFAWGFNLMVRPFFESSDFLFLTEEELIEAVELVGFKVESVETCYAGIDRLLTLRKE